MRTFRKLLLSILLIALLKPATAQQPIEIMVLGTDHENELKDSLYFRQVQAKLQAFNPDMILGEYVVPEDYPGLESGNFGRSDKIYTYANRLNPDVKYAEKKIQKAHKVLSHFENFHKVRIDLAIQYLKKHDLANAQYQIFILEEYKKRYFGKEELAYYEKHLGSRDALLTNGLFRKTSEYSTIIFPLMKQIRMKEIYSMDCQTYDLQWSAAWSLVDHIYPYIAKIAAMDPNSEEAKVINKINAEFREVERKTRLQGLSGYALLNSDLSTQYLDLINLYGGPVMFGFSKAYPDDLVKDMLKYWRLRNEGMAENAIRQIRSHHARKAIVVAGAWHQKWISDILAKEKDVKLISFNE